MLVHISTIERALIIFNGYHVGDSRRRYPPGLALIRGTGDYFNNPWGYRQRWKRLFEVPYTVVPCPSDIGLGGGLRQYPKPQRPGLERVDRVRYSGRDGPYRGLEPDQGLFRTGPALRGNCHWHRWQERTGSSFEVHLLGYLPGYWGLFPGLPRSGRGIRLPVGERPRPVCPNAGSGTLHGLPGSGRVESTTAPETVRIAFPVER